jgi:hypothetical protein
MSSACRYLNDILTYLKKYEANDPLSPLKFIIKSNDKEFTVNKFNICISGLITLLKALKNQKLRNLNRKYIQGFLECNKECSQVNSKICIKYFIEKLKSGEKFNDSIFEKKKVERESIKQHLLGKLESPKIFRGKKNLQLSKKSAFCPIETKLSSKKKFLKVDINKLITFSLDPKSGLLTFTIKNFKIKDSCLSIKKNIIKLVNENKLKSFFRQYEIPIENKDRVSSKGYFGIFKENNKWGIKIIFYHKSFMKMNVNKKKDIIDIMNLSYFFNYIIKEIIFVVLSGFIKIGFKTKWNNEDKNILWRYMIKKYNSYNLSNINMTRDDFKKIFRKLKMNNRPKSEISIREIYNKDKSNFCQTSLLSRLDYLKVYLLDCPLGEDNRLENYFSNVDFKYCSK